MSADYVVKSIEPVRLVGRTATLAWSGEAPAGMSVVDLPSVTAVCGVHLGPMTGIQESWQQLQRWVVDNKFSYAGPCREVYVKAESEDQSDWVTELQQPVSPAGG